VTAREVLDGIKAQQPRFAFDTEVILAAPSTVARLTAAVEGVLAIADSMDRIADFSLSVLSRDDMGISLRQHAEDIRTAIENALKESQ
jgi:hypothetical protein